MARLKLDPETVAFSTLMERKSRIKVKDCFIDPAGTVYFVIAPWDMGKALGKNAETIKRVQKEFGRKVRIISFSDKITEFIKKVIAPLEVQEIIEEENFILLRESNKKTKSLLIGREGKRLQLINRAVQRFFPNKEVKVV